MQLALMIQEEGSGLLKQKMEKSFQRVVNASMTQKKLDCGWSHSRNACSENNAQLRRFDNPYYQKASANLEGCYHWEIVWSTIVYGGINAFDPGDDVQKGEFIGMEQWREFSSS